MQKSQTADFRVVPGISQKMGLGQVDQDFSSFFKPIFGIFDDFLMCFSTIHADTKLKNLRL